MVTIGNNPKKLVGNVEFSGGVIVYDINEKISEKGEKINCVWTNAGYFEYPDQQLLLLDGVERVCTFVKGVENYTDDKKEPGTLQITGFTKGRCDLAASEQFMGVAVTGDERDYSNFTLNAMNNFPNAISTFNANINVPENLLDLTDKVVKHNGLPTSQNRGTYINKPAPPPKNIININI